MIKTGRFSLIAALIVPILFSCTPMETLEPEEEIISPKTGEAGSSEGLVKMEFVGTQADDDGSRTYISGSKVLWKGSDKIAVIDEAAPNVHVFDNTDTEGGATCRFIGEAADAAAWTVVYPASAFAYLPAETNKATVTIPAEQTAVPGSFAEGSYITYCRVNTKNFTMQPLVSMLKITLAYENIKQIRVLANSNDTFTGDILPLAGTFRFTSNLYYNSPVKLNYSSGLSGITLYPPAGETTFPAGDYYIPVAPLGDSNGCYQAAVTNLRLEFTREDDQVASRSKTGASITLTRGKYFDLGIVDEGLSWNSLDICFGVAASGPANEVNYRCPFVSWTNDNWTNSYDPPATMKNTVFDLDGNVVQFKLKDSGHVLKAWTQNPRRTGDGDDTRYANGSPALFFGSTAGSYLEFPAMRNRRLLRVEVQYDSTTTHDAKVGFPYVADRDASTCPRITDLTGTSIGYTMSRDGDGFHHNYILYDTALNTPYRYTLNYNGGNWTGPRVQRIRLYYSKEAAPALSLPTLSASGVSTSLRNSSLTVNLVAASAALANPSAYDVGVVVKGQGGISDAVVYLNALTPTIDGTTLTFETTYWQGGAWDNYLNTQAQFYPFVRIKGDAKDPLTMDAGTSGTNWVAGALTTITRPSYTWDISDTENYLYASDTSVELNATVTVASAVTQNYDVGFIYKLDGAADTYSNWNCTYVDQNGVGKADDEPTPANPIQGYSLANGASKTFTATLTGLMAGQTYVYKPVIIQHALCYYGNGGSPSSEAYMFKYLLFEDGYNSSNTLRTTIAGPVITYGATVPQGYYITATTGSITAGSIGVAHVKSGSSVKVGWVYGTSSSPTTEAFKSSATTVAGTMNVAATSGTLTGLPDVDGSTVYFRPFFAFNGGSRYYYPSATAKTFTCPTVSITATDYLWQGYDSADIMETATLSVGTECKVDMAYSTNNGESWTVSGPLSAGAHTFSTVTVTEGGQTVKVGARRSGSDAAWQTADVVLAHPISSVYTYGSALYTAKNSITAACSIVTNKVASNNLVEYGVQFYRDDSATIRSSDPMTAPAVAADYYNAVLTHDDIPAGISNSNAIRYWCYARLAGSKATPDAVNTTVLSSRSSQYGNRVYTWTGDVVKKRLWICFNADYSGGYYINPFLPTSASGYYSELGSSTTAMMQAGKFLLAGDHTLEFKLDSGSANKADASPSGVYVYTGDSGAMGLYAHSQADNIVTPAIDGCRAYRVCTYSTAADYLYFFVSSSDPTPAFVSGTTAFAAGYGWKNVTPGWGDSYNGKSCYMRFSGCPVTKNTANTTPVTSLGDTPPKQELKIRAFFIEYQ